MKMTELKTLKNIYMELKVDDPRGPMSYHKDLKKEAIKWIKDDRHCSNTNPCKECKGLINGFKAFFNITEENLK